MADLEARNRAARVEQTDEEHSRWFVVVYGSLIISAILFDLLYGSLKLLGVSHSFADTIWKGTVTVLICTLPGFVMEQILAKISRTAPITRREIGMVCNLAVGYWSGVLRETMGSLVKDRTPTPTI